MAKCWTCKHWGGTSSTYRGECALAPGWRPAYDDSCRRHEYKLRGATAAPEQAEAKDAADVASLDQRVRDARKAGQP